MRSENGKWSSSNTFIFTFLIFSEYNKLVYDIYVYLIHYCVYVYFCILCNNKEENLIYKYDYDTLSKLKIYFDYASAIQFFTANYKCLIWKMTRNAWMK